MNFIDIASWQATIDLATVFAQNPLDGVVIKATQNTNYVNPYCDPWVQYCIKNGRPWGFYHYLEGTDPVSEAKFFVKHTTNYFHDGVPVADYEGSIVSSYGTYYLKKWLDTVYQETGVKPMVYCNLGTIQADVNGFRSIAEEGYPLWLAQWIGNITNFQPHPPQSGSFAPFTKLTMHQYTDKGRLSGYTGNLDLDIFYGTIDDWNILAGKKEKPTPEPEPTPSEDELAKCIRLMREALDILCKYTMNK